MLKFWRAYSVHLVWGTVALFFILGLLTLHPIYADICAKDAETGAENCTRNHILLYAIKWIGEASHYYHGILTALATAFIAWFTWTLRRSTDKLAEAGERQIDIAEKQMLIAGLQTDIQKKQHAIGRLQFIADKRPTLRIRHVLVEHPAPNTSHRTPLFQADKIITGSLVVLNAGGTEARFVESRYRIFLTNSGLPMDPPLNDEDSASLHHPAEVSIQGGESCTFPIRGTEPPGHFAKDVMSRSNNWRLYIMGFIRYSDINDVERFTGFCREYFPGGTPDSEGRFRPVTDPDYEYQD